MMENEIAPLEFDKAEAAKESLRYVCRICFSNYVVQPIGHEGQYGLWCPHCGLWARNNSKISKEEARQVEYDRNQQKIKTFPIEQSAKESIKELGFG